MEKQYDIYEYITVRIKYSLAEDCRTCYESFGWETIQERISNDGKKLQFRRRRNIAERGRLMEQQRRMENAMAQVEHYENQRELVPIMICILVGLAGAGVLALEEKFEEKDLELEIDLEEEIRISNDASLLEIAWNNILGNAVKYTEPGGTVSVSARLEREQAERVSDIGKGRDTVTRAVVCIRDTGCGMAPEAAQHMFDQFYQGDTSHASEGNGLGLAMVARVMELCKGEISVDTKEGEGTAITVRLPLE